MSVFYVQSADGEKSGKTIVRQLNLAGIAISAVCCHSGKSTPSPVLLAMGYQISCFKSYSSVTWARHNS